ncbi:pca operon transcription factor PcaQ [Pelagibacterium sediminicola]|uniref:pca operon transcription factor PcaQ n=1 Tax=Pelagibacterium sediminicola TaxID=2248761 RepID=UPI000E324423|nr:pca operon transcription factor PcaQ [Pelagibacterium sediminicola]
MAAPLIDPRIRLRHLTAFVETERQGGVAAAAAALGLTQPAISKSLAELEDIVGVALFDRSRRKLELSGFGVMFLRYANTVVAALRQGMNALADAQGAESVVRLGALPSVEVEIVPQAVARFASEALGRRVHVESGPSPHLLGLLRAGSLDFVVGRMPDPGVMAGLTFEHLYSETLVLAVRPDHPLGGQEKLDLSMVESYPGLVPPRGAIIRPTVEALLVAAGTGRLAREIETVSNSFGRAYTLLTDAVWFISRSVVAEDLARGELITLPVDMAASHGAIGITTRAGNDFDMATAALMAAVRDAAYGRVSP